MATEVKESKGTFDVKESKGTFSKAINEGRLSADPSARNYAGYFMYMFTLDGQDYFKNSLTRQYLPGKGL